MIERYSTKWYELRDVAAAMYDGGWRAEDREEIRREFNEVARENGDGPCPEDELDVVCELLAVYAAKAAEN